MVAATQAEGVSRRCVTCTRWSASRIWTSRSTSTAAKLGLKEVRRIENEKGRYTLVFVAPEENPEAQVELTYNWDPEVYTGGRNFGHLAYSSRTSTRPASA
jgi:catechol 2,3-dioxygenase-like lactoylglutathione lyase family enzyme